MIGKPELKESANLGLIGSDQNLGFRFYHEIEGTGGERWHESETNLEVFIADYKFNHPFHCIDSMDISDLVNLEQQFVPIHAHQGIYSSFSC